ESPKTPLTAPINRKEASVTRLQAKTNYNKGNTNSTRHRRQNELTTPNRKMMKTKSMQITTHSTKRNQDLPTEIYNAEIDDAEINDTERANN
ncbi:30964_t:CDS:2, partial [Racocetra persica]